ncbi:MAG: diguanylate cyclase [Coriobacteriaceae bacterium]|nr:diguanylate cyclase [Coriobacteriaceae bacterium]
MDYDLNDIEFVERTLGALPSLIFFKDRNCRYVFSTKHWNHINADGENWTVRGKTDLDIRKNRENALLAMEEDRKIVATGVGSTYTIHENVDGVGEYMEVIKRPVFDDDGKVIGIAGLVNDITEKEELRMRWERSANTDALTGLYNRRFFDDVKDSFSRHQYPLAVIMADCDNLKVVNDSLGHGAGDDFIRSAAVALKSAMPAESLIFRIGGDEFVALVPNTDEKEALHYVERASQLVEQMSVGSGSLSVSFGLSMVPNRLELVEHALQRADEGMYQTKRIHHLASAVSAADDPEAAAEEFSFSRKYALDNLHAVLEEVAAGAYVYVCDMKSGYSKWSEPGVRRFGLPGEYMFDAGLIWEEHIHADDRQLYHNSIEAIFAGEDESHDMQYRAADKDGSYVLCTCRGKVLRSEDGTPEFFAGTIRDNGNVRYTDDLTSLQNHYTLFDRLDALSQKRERACMMLVGIDHFSAVNEAFGYEFGNTVICKVAQLLKAEFRNEGCLYRVDGVRFVLLTHSIRIGELPARFEALKKKLRALAVEGQVLDMFVFGAALEVKSFDSNPRTLYACLEHSSNVSRDELGGAFRVFDVEQDELPPRAASALH